MVVNHENNNIWYFTIFICKPNFLGSEILLWVKQTCIPNKEARFLCMLTGPKDPRVVEKGVKKDWRYATRGSNGPVYTWKVWLL